MKKIIFCFLAFFSITNAFANWDELPVQVKEHEKWFKKKHQEIDKDIKKLQRTLKKPTKATFENTFEAFNDIKRKMMFFFNWTHTEEHGEYSKEDSEELNKIKNANREQMLKVSNNLDFTFDCGKLLHLIPQDNQLKKDLADVICQMNQEAKFSNDVKTQEKIVEINNSLSIVSSAHAKYMTKSMMIPFEDLTKNATAELQEFSDKYSDLYVLEKNDQGEDVLTIQLNPFRTVALLKEISTPSLQKILYQIIFDRYYPENHDADVDIMKVYLQQLDAIDNLYLPLWGGADMVEAKSFFEFGKTVSSDDIKSMLHKFHQKQEEVLSKYQKELMSHRQNSEDKSPLQAYEMYYLQEQVNKKEEVPRGKKMSGKEAVASILDYYSLLGMKFQKVEQSKLKIEVYKIFYKGQEFELFLSYNASAPNYVAGLDLKEKVIAMNFVIDKDQEVEMPYARIKEILHELGQLQFILEEAIAGAYHLCSHWVNQRLVNLKTAAYLSEALFLDPNFLKIFYEEKDFAELTNYIERENLFRDLLYLAQAFVDITLATRGDKGPEELLADILKDYQRYFFPMGVHRTKAFSAPFAPYNVYGKYYVYTLPKGIVRPMVSEYLDDRGLFRPESVLNYKKKLLETYSKLNGAQTVESQVRYIEEIFEL